MDQCSCIHCTVSANFVPEHVNVVVQCGNKADIPVFVLISKTFLELLSVYGIMVHALINY